MSIMTWFSRLFGHDGKNEQVDSESAVTEAKAISHYDQDTEARLFFVSKRDLYVPMKYLEMDGNKTNSTARKMTDESESSGFGGWIPYFSEDSEAFYTERFFSDEQLSKLDTVKKGRALMEQPLASGRELVDAKSRSEQVLRIVGECSYSERANELTKLIVEWHLNISVSPLTGDSLNELIENGCDSFDHLFSVDEASLLALKGVGAKKANEFKKKFSSETALMLRKEDGK